MLSLLKHVYNLFDYDYQKELYTKKFDEESQHFDEELEKEQILEVKTVAEPLDQSKDEGTCSKRTGVITSLRESNGTIDRNLFFDMTAAPLFHELKVGCTVEYLAYQSLNSDYLKVKKVEMLQDNSWDEAPSEEQIQKTIETLKSEDPKFFNTHQRSILGLIVSRNQKFLTVDTDYKEITVDLDAVSMDFIPKEGDRVYLNCNVQTDEAFADLAGEILEIITVHPARTKKEQGVIKKLHEDWGIIDSDCYFTNDTVDSDIILSEGDQISAEMIECERGIFVWRCLKIRQLKRATPKESTTKPPAETMKNNIKAITITDNLRFTFENAFETQELEVEIQNNSEHVHKVTRVYSDFNRRNSQLKLEDLAVPLTVEPGAVKKITVSCESRFYGHTKEKVFFCFANFKIYRTIQIAVGVDEDKENEDAAKLEKSTPRPRQYSHEVWSKKKEIIPGVKNYNQRRFIPHRIHSYEVPERLRSALLMDSARTVQIAAVDDLYPALKEELDMQNYVTRFQTLLFIEEIEHFVNFRLFDRDRAHFTREGEYLALTIENLAEKRPSLVLGDTVRATNPWVEEEANRAYEGCIHKVLFNRILLKFNPAFQNKYNGEDYCLVFYFSRFNFRKQHYGIQKIVNKRGANFLFASKIVLSDKVQVDASLSDDGHLMIDNKVLPEQWSNSTLNSVQKMAVVNVLRGEARAMPYVIFGPPGTGKTVTIVEAILQLMRNMPNSRILVGAPSNSAADLITSRLIGTGELNPGQLVRVVSQRVIDKDVIADHLKQYCVTADICADGSAKETMTVTESGIKLLCTMKYLGRHKVTIGTCSILSNLLQMDFPRGHFTHLFIDESGQCTEPEIMSPLCLLSPESGQVILAGDPCQLGPVVVNNFARDRGLGLSFLERLVGRFPYRKDKVRFPNTGYDPRLVTKLIYNYRALPSILHVYSTLFYDAELVAELSAVGNKEYDLLQSIQSLLPKSETRPVGHAAFFHGIRGENKQDSDSPSWYNPIEAKHVFLMIIQLYRLNVIPDQIGIITPYQKQVRILRSLFAEADVAMPKIGTVEEFQGQERQIVIISTVRSSKDFINLDLKYALGFASSPKRMNVAISRARSLLYVCGNPHLLSASDKWREFIKYCVENDSYIGCDLPENLPPAK